MNNLPFDNASINDDALNDPFAHNECPDYCETQRLYVERNQDKRLLVVFCIGLKDDNGVCILDATSKAWNAQPIDVHKPLRAEHFLAKVKRRGELFDVQPRPKLAQWNMEKMTSWLLEQPICNPTCVEFLTTEAARVTAIFEEALRVKNSEKLVQLVFGREMNLGFDSYIAFWTMIFVNVTCNGIK